MNILAAMGVLEQEVPGFGPPAASHRVHEVSSGSCRESARMPHPALWVSEDDAVLSFIDTMRDLVTSMMQEHHTTRWWWHRAPVVERHFMTEQDARGSQRVTQDRWAVSAAVGVA